MVSKIELDMRRRTEDCSQCGRKVTFYENDFNVFVTGATCCHCRMAMWEGMRPRHLRLVK